jgi:peptidoglycan/xylan/chitin deacetylase (PgdA/CDA1 family)
MYHVVAAPPTGAPFPELYVAPTDFAAQVSWLARAGYHAVTLRAVYDHWTRGEALPPNPIVLSFDDGYLSHVVHALPILRARRWPGVLNLEVRNETQPWGLSQRRVRRLIAAGWEIDAHTINHPDLTRLDAAALRHEVAGSRAIIRRQFHVPVDFFCYPAGRYNDAVVAEVRAAGYLGATTTAYGLARPSQGLYTMHRVRVNGSDGAAGLASKLRSLQAS